MLTRIRNSLMVRKPWVEMPFSGLKESVAKILQDEGYIKSYEVMRDERFPVLKIGLKYYKDKPVIAEIKRISRPGLRSYCKFDEIPQIRSGLGICILSTSGGVITGQEARKLKVGGELLCTVF